MQQGVVRTPCPEIAGCRTFTPELAEGLFSAPPLRSLRLCVRFFFAFRLDASPRPLTNTLLDNSISNCHTSPIEKCARDLSCAGFPLNLNFNLSGELLCPLTRTVPARAPFSSPTAAAADIRRRMSALSLPKGSSLTPPRSESQGGGGEESGEGGAKDVRAGRIVVHRQKQKRNGRIRGSWSGLNNPDTETTATGIHPLPNRKIM
jgi:hypothetical protein